MNHLNNLLSENAKHSLIQASEMWDFLLFSVLFWIASKFIDIKFYSGKQLEHRLLVAALLKICVPCQSC